MSDQAFVPPSSFLGRKPLQRRSRCQAALRASATPDVVVIGAGVAGLSTAYELAQKGASVKVISSPARKPAALASAGMLAPEAESLSGDMNTLSRVSREMYPDFVRRLQQLVDMDVQYVSRNDFLIPSFIPVSGPNVLSGDALRSVEPTLGPMVKAARRSAGDASVDSRRLISALHKACVALGVKFEEDTVSSVVVAPDAQSVEAILTKTSRVIGGHYLVASGAWTASLLPHIPINPVKGQMLSLSPSENSPRLNHVLYGDDVYIVPKNGGNEFYVGATVERVGFDSKVTATGINQLLSKAMELVPTFAEYEIREMWTGLRPATPDLTPVIGRTEYQNVTIASGFYRNGILLAPATSVLAASFVLEEVDRLPRHLQELAPRFSYERLLRPDKDMTAQRGGHAKQPVHNPSSSLQEQRVGDVPSEPESSSEIKVWKINKDGSEEPVSPSEHYQQVHAKSVRPSSVSFTSKIDLNASVLKKRRETSRASEPVDSGVYQGGEGYSPRQEDLEQVSGENDAYEDVMRKRANADEVMSRAMAANRAFGRKRSSLEADGSVALSISEEEVAAFDAALTQGIEDMKKLEKHFDPNDPSVRRTQAEKEMSGIETTESNVRVNGVAVPSFGEDSSSSESEPAGYY